MSPIRMSNAECMACLPAGREIKMSASGGGDSPLAHLLAHLGGGLDSTPRENDSVSPAKSFGSFAKKGQRKINVEAILKN